jgi:predicted GNAT family N-acyltransferase
MEISLQRIAHGSAEYEAAVALRYRILRQPLGLDFSPEQLAAEAADIHLAAFAEERLIGCLLLTAVSNEEVKMRQVAVEESFRGQGIGSRLVAFAEQVAREHGYRTMSLHAREEAVPFYLRLGYETVGDPFIEITIPHREMRKVLLTGP